MIEEQMGNEVSLSGIICEPIRFSVRCLAESMYKSAIFVKRPEGAVSKDSRKKAVPTEDVIPVVFPGRVLGRGIDLNGCFVWLTGEYRSRNRHEDRSIEMYVFVKSFRLMGDQAFFSNTVSLKGRLCRPLHYVRMGNGVERQAFTLAVHRSYKRTDYITCFCLGERALYAKTLESGTYLCLKGRIESRPYQKRCEEGIRHGIAYEVRMEECPQIDQAICPEGEAEKEVGAL